MNKKNYKVLILILSIFLTIMGMGCSEVVTPPDTSSPDTPQNFCTYRGW